MEGNQEIPVFFNQHLNTKLSESASSVAANDEVDIDNKGVRILFQYFTKFVSILLNIQQNLEFSSDVDLESVTKTYNVAETTEAAKTEKEEI